MTHTIKEIVFDQEADILRKWIRVMCSILLMCVMILGASVYVYYWDKTPETIKIEAGSTQEFRLSIPANGTIKNLTQKEAVADVFFMKPITMKAGSRHEDYEVALKLYGVLPFKKISIEVIDEKKIWPVGRLYGFYLKTKGVLVIGTGEFVDSSGNSVFPVKNKIFAGDYIFSINGEEIDGKRQFQKMIAESEGDEITLLGERNGKVFTACVTPKEYENGEYKLGLWIRDNAQGVGTVTFVDESGNFGALGHPITDADTNQILEIEDGRLYDAQILSIQKGKRNEVGEIHGLIDYQNRYLEGNLIKNDEDGIYGYSQMLLESEMEHESIPIAMRQEVHTGAAEIICDVEGVQKTYRIQITEVRMDDNSNQALSIKVTDKELLKVTGGIVQGMSGSPIIQDGKLVGAVTHVLISDPSSGYGIFIEDMLEH